MARLLPMIEATNRFSVKRTVVGQRSPPCSTGTCLYRLLGLVVDEERRDPDPTRRTPTNGVSLPESGPERFFVGGGPSPRTPWKCLEVDAARSGHGGEVETAADNIAKLRH